MRAVRLEQLDGLARALAQRNAKADVAHVRAVRVLNVRPREHRHDHLVDAPGLDARRVVAVQQEWQETQPLGS